MSDGCVRRMFSVVIIFITDKHSDWLIFSKVSSILSSASSVKMPISVENRLGVPAANSRAVPFKYEIQLMQTQLFRKDKDVDNFFGQFRVDTFARLIP